jgi:hypothetical protein
MTIRDKTLVILLRTVGVTALLALIAAFMPLSWMAAAHGWMGLGEMPTGPIVAYLARSVSLFYSFVGALFLVVTTNLDRYRPIVQFLGLAFALMSIVIFGVDLAASMPWWWTTFEGPPGVVFGIVICLLAHTNHQKNNGEKRI